MTQSETFLDGGCACGAVRYRVRGTPVYAGMCHCDDCRRATGGAYVPWFGATPDNVSVSKGEMAEFSSPAGVRRGFCGTCGSSLTFSGGGYSLVSLTIASLDDPNRLTPVNSVFEKEKLHWVTPDDGMRHFDEFPMEIKGER